MSLLLDTVLKYFLIHLTLNNLADARYDAFAYQMITENAACVTMTQAAFSQTLENYLTQRVKSILWKTSQRVLLGER